MYVPSSGNVCDSAGVSGSGPGNEEQGWIRAGSAHRSRQRKQTKPHKILRCSATQRPDGCRPPAGLTDLVADDDLDTLKQKFEAKRQYFLHSSTGRAFLKAVIRDLDQAIFDLAPQNLDTKSIDVLCLGLGNPAVDRASLCQLVVLDLLLTRDTRLSRERTRLYDPVFRSVARAFIREIGMQVLETNEEACYPLDPDRYHFVMLPHCAPALVNNLLYANWNPDLLGRVILFSNSWPHVRRELAATGEPEKLITRELAYIHALEPIMKMADQPQHADETNFEGMRIHWFPALKLAQLPATTWTGPNGAQLERPTLPDHPVHPKILSSGDCFYADLISRELISKFLDSPRD